MKKLIILFAICVSLMAGAQDTVNNFHIRDGKVIWEKEYPGQYKINSIVSAMKRSGDFINIDTSEGEILANLKPSVPDIKGAGFSRGSVSIIVSGGDVEGFVIVSFADSGMHVAIKKVVFIQRESISMFKIGEKTDLELMALNGKGKFKTSAMWNWAQISKILDFTFNDKISQLIK